MSYEFYAGTGGGRVTAAFISISSQGSIWLSKGLEQQMDKAYAWVLIGFDRETNCIALKCLDDWAIGASKLTGRRDMLASHCCCLTALRHFGLLSNTPRIPAQFKDGMIIARLHV